ncbi:MAG: DUF3068 domain-containing protein [Actinomycetia bacterium]|nr:DUF3068 domain-containing protein [Actinomycetes bacterium]
MRKSVGYVLLGLGAFLLTTALLVAFYVPGQVKKTPLDTNSETRLSGHAAAVPSGESGPVRALSHTVANGQLSDSDVVVFDTFTCLVLDDGSVEDCTDDGEMGSPLITASTDSFATDRVTAEAVQDEKYVSSTSRHEGLVNKFPFDVKQETYPFWDGVLGRTVDAVFQGEEQVEGFDTYRFMTNVQNESAEIASGIQGTYSSEKTMWIDPVTGQIIKQHELQTRQTADGTTVLDLDFGFTDETVAANIESARDNGGQLSLLSTAPWILGLLGLLALAGGGFLATMARGDEVARDEVVRDRGHVDDQAYVESGGATEAGAYEDRTDQFFEEATEADTETRRSRRDEV